MNKMCYHCMKESMQNGRCTCCGRPASENKAGGICDELPPGTLLDHGNIVVGELLGHGGFGITYVARDSSVGLIALKEFYPRSSASRDGTSVVVTNEEEFMRYMSDFKREVKHLLNLKDHPNIVKVLFDLNENNTFYYGMELLQGESLRTLLERKHRLDPLEAFRLLDPILSALSYAHEHQTLHRDIAPDNIFLRENVQNPEYPTPCLIDFGAAFTDKTGFTFVAPAVKKRGFSPPDQGLPYAQQGPFIDVYAVTATYYNMVTGCIPPAAVNRQKMQLRPASSLNPAVSRQLDSVIAKGMALNHEKRYQTIAELRNDLCKALKATTLKIAVLTCIKGPMKGVTFLLNKKSLLIGRDAALQIVDGDRLASRKHCEVTFENSCWYIEDLQSHNGTYLNNKKIPPRQRVQLVPGTVITIGLEELRFSYK